MVKFPFSLVPTEIWSSLMRTLAPLSGSPCSEVTLPEITAPWPCAIAGLTPAIANSIQAKNFL